MDFGLFTCYPTMTRGILNLSHFPTGHSESPISVALLVVPVTMRPRLIELIRRGALWLTSLSSSPSCALQQQRESLILRLDNEIKR